MKALRRSLNKDSSHTSQQRVPSSISRPAQSAPPPQKVIRALSNYRSNAPQELSFLKGDFFYVKDEMNGSGWYEAHNPLTGARGLVPVEYFETFGRGGARTSVTAGNLPSNMSNPNSPPLSNASSQPGRPGKGAFYAVVQYDFEAERADELDCKAGESILVIAQSNREWFVAKPIGRLGGAGLIPVSFVEIRDPSTDKPIANVEELIDRGEIPKVEEWKQKAAQYKAATIPLGKFDLPADSTGVINSPFATTGQYPFPTEDEPSSSGPSQGYDQPNIPPASTEDGSAPVLYRLPPGIPLSAEVTAFHHEREECYFKIPAVWQPDPDGGSKLSRIHLTLYRTYEDFYTLQIQLLDHFPVEAGRSAPEGSAAFEERILPFMPGPVSEVTDVVLAQRQTELDIYLRQLCDLRRSHQRILRSDEAWTFFSLRAGDTQKYAGLTNGDEDFDGALMALPQQMAKASLHNHESSSTNSTRPRTSSGRSGLSTAPTSASPPTEPGDGRSRASSGAGHGRIAGNGAGGYNPDYPPAPLWSASRLAASPAISANVPQPAYLKIKVFNAQTDDIVAIRVHPRVSFAELMQKIRERVGAVTRVRYRGSKYRPGTGDLGTILENDEQMVEWFVSGERLILYAE
ncbi:hypothetical protein DACRYDRAFT_119394 [Dacryopinax primogenitus]|uniref:Uncharacterized protein n=1 Tax=Dacryopinax primogenitus (strain DJM 731) TaxID=1858805 RepID=M5FQI2_DACPD|nr:uncharacterized protein DACRYDRAFT_119394 [Dacryopinax primogenitus]EJT97738.1 hypothetical protein DACRYDRAFT_119394 [Dacryopinax primogenitus]